MCKNVVKFDEFLFINKDLNCNEIVMLKILFKYHNEKIGYSYPTYEILMDCMHCKSRTTVSRTLKSLIKKGYIVIDKQKNNRYYITGIENFITTAEKKEDDPVEEVEEVEEVDPVEEDERILLAKNTITVGKISKKLRKLLISTDREIIKTAIENIKNKSMITATYLYNAINLVLDKVRTTAAKFSDNAAESVKGFNNFTGREYSAEYYASIEEQLTAWI